MTSTTKPTSPPDTESGKNAASTTDIKSLGASLTGQILEWYEWSSYAVFAPFIATAMFNKGDSTSALLATFGVLPLVSWCVHSEESSSAA